MAQGRCFGGGFWPTAKLRVRVETPGPPELGKERLDGKVCIFVERPHPSNGSGDFILRKRNRGIQAVASQ